MISSALVTGAGGFIGGAVCRALVERNIRVVALSTAATPPAIGVEAVHRFRLPDARLGDLLVALKPNLIVHCAGPASVAASFAAPGRDFADSVGITEHLLSSVARHSPTSRVLLLSSAAVLGQPDVLPASEQLPPAPISPYGFHKSICETLGVEYSTLWGVPVATARLFSVYGPGLKRQLLWDIYRQWSSSDAIRLDGDGDETRDFIYIDDVATAVLVMADRASFKGECIHVGSGEAISTATLAQEAVAALGARKPIHFSGVRRVGDPRHWQADISRLKAIGMTVLTPLDGGLIRWADWVRRQ